MREKIDEKQLNYSRYLSWRGLVDDHVISHEDGRVSLMIEWSGLDCQMNSYQDRSDSFSKLFRYLDKLPTGIISEFHFWREFDESVAERYLEQNKRIIRSHEIGTKIRHLLAEHIAPYGKSNRVAIVLSKSPYTDKNLTDIVRYIFSTKSKALDSNLHLNSALLKEKANDILRFLPDSKIVKADKYLSSINQTINRNGFINKQEKRIDYRFPLADQLLYQAPNVRNGQVWVDNVPSKTLLVYMMPENTDPNWFLSLSTLSIPVHVSQIISPRNTKKDIQKSTKKSRREVAELNSKLSDEEFLLKSARAAKAYREYLVNNNLKSFDHCYIIQLFGTEEQNNKVSKEIFDLIKDQGGEVRDHDDLQLHFWRIALPGMGYYSQYFREDSTDVAAYMSPVIVHDEGLENPEILRLCTNQQLAGFGFLQHKVRNGISIAMTGAGKGTEKGLEILETYPLGLDWYIAEMGETYPWIVEGFGGNYIRIDPDKTVVNPLPLFSLADNQKDEPLPTSLVTGTINSLAFLLTDGLVDLTKAQSSAGNRALQNLYRDTNNENDRTAPNLKDLLDSFKKCDYINEEQSIAAKGMASKLECFLDDSFGQIFTGDDNLDITPGITGVDFNKLSGMPQMLEFYLVFVSLRFAQMAFYSRTQPARVLLDELHKFIDASPIVVGRLIREISRMGRKEDASIDLVTQNITEINVIDKEVITSATLRNIMYRQDGHSEIAKVLELPDHITDKWSQWLNPESEHLDYRNSMRSVHGRYYETRLMFPQIFLDIMTTNPDELAMKEHIKKNYKTSDMFERSLLLRERINNV